MNAFELFGDFGMRDAILRMEARHAAFDRLFEQVSARMHSQFFGYRVPTAPEPREPRVLIEFPTDGEPPPARPSGLEITEVIDTPPASPEPRASRVADLVEEFEPGRRRSKEIHEDLDHQNRSKMFDIRIESPKEDNDFERNTRRRSSGGRVSSLIHGFNSDRCNKVLDVHIEPSSVGGTPQTSHEHRNRIDDIIKGFDVPKKNNEGMGLDVRIKNSQYSDDSNVSRESQSRVADLIEGYDSGPKILNVHTDSSSHSGSAKEFQESHNSFDSDASRTRFIPVHIESSSSGHSLSQHDVDEGFNTEDPDRRNRKVGFCKTEVHYVPGSGRINIVDSDEKPPPTQLFRRRRRKPVPKVIFDSRTPRGPDKENSNTIIHHFSIESVSGVRHNSASSANLFRPITPVDNSKSVSVGSSFMHEPKAKRAESSDLSEKALGHVSPKLQSLLKNSMMADFSVTKSTTVSKSKQVTSESTASLKRSSKQSTVSETSVKRNDSFKTSSKSTKTSDDSKKTRVLQESNMMNGTSKKNAEKGKTKTESLKTINIKVSNDEADRKKKNSFSMKGGIVVVVNNSESKRASSQEKEGRKSHKNKVLLNKSESFKSSPKFVQKQESFNANGTKIRVSTTVARTPSMKTDSLKRKESGEKSAFKPVVKKEYSDSDSRMEKVLAAREKVAKKALIHGKFVQTSKSNESEHSSHLTRSEAFAQRKSTVTSESTSSRKASKNELDSLDRRHSRDSPDGKLSSSSVVQKVPRSEMRPTESSQRRSSASPEKKIVSSIESARQKTTKSETKTDNRSSPDQKTIVSSETASAFHKVSKSESRVSEERRLSSSPERSVLKSTEAVSAIQKVTGQQRRGSGSPERKMISSEVIQKVTRQSDERRRSSSGSGERKQSTSVVTSRNESSHTGDVRKQSSNSRIESTSVSKGRDERRSSKETPERSSYVIKGNSPTPKQSRDSPDRKTSPARAEAVKKSKNDSVRRSSRDSPDRKLQVSSSTTSASSSKATKESFSTIESLDSASMSSIARRMETPSPLFMNKDLLRRSFRRESTLVNSILGSHEENRAILATGPRDGTINFSETTLVSPYIMKGAARHSLRSTPTFSSDSEDKTPFPDVVSSAVGKDSKSMKTKSKETKEKVLKSRHSSDAVVSTKSSKSVTKTRSSSSVDVVSDQKKISSKKKEDSEIKESSREFGDSRKSPEKVLINDINNRRDSGHREHVSKTQRKQDSTRDKSFSTNEDFIQQEQSFQVASSREHSEEKKEGQKASDIIASFENSRRHSKDGSYLVEEYIEESSENTTTPVKETKRVKNMIAEITQSSNGDTAVVEEQIMKVHREPLGLHCCENHNKVKSLIQEFSSIESSHQHTDSATEPAMVMSTEDGILNSTPVQVPKKTSNDSSAHSKEKTQRTSGVTTVKGLVQERSELFESKAREIREDSSPTRIGEISRRDSVQSDVSGATHVLEKSSFLDTDLESERRQSRDSRTISSHQVIQTEEKSSRRSSKTQEISEKRHSRGESARRELFPEESIKKKKKKNENRDSQVSKEKIQEKEKSRKRTMNNENDETTTSKTSRVFSREEQYGMIQNQRRKSGESSGKRRGSSEQRTSETRVLSEAKFRDDESYGRIEGQRSKDMKRRQREESSEEQGGRRYKTRSTKNSKDRHYGDDARGYVKQPAQVSSTSVVRESTRFSSGRVTRHRDETVAYSVDRLEEPEYATLGAAERREKVKEVTERLSRRGEDTRRGKEPLRRFEKISNGWVEGNVQEHSRSSRAVVSHSSQSTASQLSAGSKRIEEITYTSS